MSEPLDWLQAAIVAHNADLDETVVTLTERVLAARGVAPHLEAIALTHLLHNAPPDSLPDRMGMATINQRYVASLRADPLFQALSPWPGRPVRQPGPIRIGYLWDFIGRSVDFCFPHLHDRNRYAAIALNFAGPQREMERCGFDQVIEYHQEDLPTALRQLRAADLDILIDLNGRAANRLSDMLVEARVAPRQAMYGNFFWPTQSPSVDFLIADRSLLPALDPAQLRETPIAIDAPIMAVRNPGIQPHAFQANVPPRPFRLRLGTTGNCHKLSSAFLDLLAAAMAAIPDASFFYHSCSSPDFLEHLRQRLMERGVAPARLELFVTGQIDYVSGVNALDAAIDAIPYNGHLSTVEFLSLGTPVWSLQGPGFTQRYGGMILGHLGLEEQVFTDASALIADLARRITVKERSLADELAKRVHKSGISDPLRATRLFEAAIEACLRAG